MNISGNMEVVLALCLLVGVAVSRPQDTYDTKYDSIDLDEILKNERLFKNYVNCLIGEGKCTDDAQYLKDSLPDALKNECKNCSEKQKAGGEKVVKFLVENKPDIYRKIAKIYDPEGIYKKKYNKKAQELGIKLID